VERRDHSIAAVFFDFGGVIAQFDREEVRRIEEKYGLPQGGLIPAIYGIPEWREVEVGRIPDEEWLEAVRRKLDEVAGRPVPELHEEWRQMWAGLDEDVVRLAQRLRGPYRVGLISNSTKRLEKELLERNGVHHLFDVVINSARVGVAKPDARIYHLAAEQIGAQPARCVHIDDLQENVRGAQEAGFQAVHYRGDYPALERELREMGVEW